MPSNLLDGMGDLAHRKSVDLGRIDCNVIADVGPVPPEFAMARGHGSAIRSPSRGKELAPIMPDFGGLTLVVLCLVGFTVATYLWSRDSARQARALNVLQLLLRARNDPGQSDVPDPELSPVEGGTSTGNTERGREG